MKLSVVTTAHNNQDVLGDCLKSVAFADELIVINNESTDKTAEIAKKHGAKVYNHKNDPTHLNESKNFGFTKAKGEWIISLDPDERVEEGLKEEILEIINQSKSEFNGYKIPRHNIIFGKVIKHGLWYPDYQTRLFKKGKGKFPNIHNHEPLKVTGEVGVLKQHIEHLNYQSVSQYIQKIDKQYSDNEAETFLAQGRGIKWYDAIRFPAQDFLTNYFARQAYKDGLHGLVLSLLQAIYMFVVFAKIWEKQGFTQTNIELADSQREIKKVGSQLTYWYMKEKGRTSSLPKKIWYKIISKFSR